MKRKILIIFLSIMTIVSGLFCIGCNGANVGENTGNSNNQQILAIYNTYKAYAEERGENPLSYEDWLATIKGQDGQNGNDGIGIADMKIEGGKLYVKYSNSDSFVELGQVKGDDGTNGQNGNDGIGIADMKIEGGKLYVKYSNSDSFVELGQVKGDDGTNGQNGSDGISIADMKIEDGKLYVKYSNSDSFVELGQVKGADGTNGTNGQNGNDGVGIGSAYIDEDGNLILVLNDKDETEINAGQVVAPVRKLDEKNKIVFSEEFTVDDKNVSIIVGDEKEDFWFNDYIDIKGYANYSVYTDKTCKEEVVAKVVDLEYGENVFYILEYCGDYNKLYIATIYYCVSIGTQYFKALNEDTNYYDNVISNLTNAVKSKVDQNLIKEIKIYKNNKIVNQMKSINFGYYDYVITYNSDELFDSTGEIVFAPCQRAVIDSDLHDENTFYAEFILDGNIVNDKLINPKLKGSAKQLSEYFSEEWNAKKIDRFGVDWSIYSYGITFKISEQRLEEYLNWNYGFFTFSDNIKNLLTGDNKYSMRFEIKNDEFYDDNGGHKWSLKYKESDINFLENN